MLDAMVDNSKEDMERASVTRGEITVQADPTYDTFARLSNRLCVNIATFVFPLSKKMSA